MYSICRYLPQSMQMNRYLNRCSCSTMCSHWTIYFLHFYRLSWAFERHQLVLWLNVTKIRFVYVLTSTQPVLNHSFFVAATFPVSLYLSIMFRFCSFVDGTLMLKCLLWIERDEKNICPFTHSIVRQKKINQFVASPSQCSIVSINWSFYRLFIPFQCTDNWIWNFCNVCNEKKTRKVK